MAEPRETRQSYDRLAGEYAAEIAEELQHKPYDRGLLDAFAESAGGGTVADVGCGPGHVGAYLAVAVATSSDSTCHLPCARSPTGRRPCLRLPAT